jgi:hypothetical protein
MAFQEDALEGLRLPLDALDLGGSANESGDAVLVDDTEAVAVHDAEAVLARALEDEREATRIRARYRTQGPSYLDPDDTIGPDLVDGERLFAVRPAAQVERHDPAGRAIPHPGRLYLTTQRLVVTGAMPLSVAVADIREVALAGERLLVSLVDGSGLTLDVSWPRVLRVQIAAALFGLRA